MCSATGVMPHTTVAMCKALATTTRVVLTEVAFPPSATPQRHTSWRDPHRACLKLCMRKAALRRLMSQMLRMRSTTLRPRLFGAVYGRACRRCWTRPMLSLALAPPPILLVMVMVMQPVLRRCLMMGAKTAAARMKTGTQQGRRDRMQKQLHEPCATVRHPPWHRRPRHRFRALTTRTLLPTAKVLVWPATVLLVVARKQATTVVLPMAVAMAMAAAMATAMAMATAVNLACYRDSAL